MNLKYSQCICFLLFIIAPLHGESDFIATRQQLKACNGYKNLVLIASPGRSGSTLLTDTIKKYTSRYKVLKTHLLPPSIKYKGKILFIFSDPDKAAESALHRVLSSPSHGATHFSNVETADRKWFDELGRSGSNQNEIHNLLAYDALGYTRQLEVWLHTKAQPCYRKEAQILAIKYEHLWEPATMQAIQEFLQLKSFQLPAKIERGCDTEELFPLEATLRKMYNVGTENHPIYHAYDQARSLWKQAPPFQFLKLVP